MPKLVTIVTPCFNEQDNVNELSERIINVMKKFPYNYEHVFIDNHSTDDTVPRIRALAASDPRIKLIINARNFGHIRSPYHAILQSTGDACILISSDLQDPPEIIEKFIGQWEAGFKTVLATKPQSEESRSMRWVRKLFYHFVSKISDVPLVRNATGAGLFDKDVIKVLRKIDDPYPYFRGLVCEIGFPIALVPFRQPKRVRGITKNNFYTLYDMAMLGITNHSKIPLRVMTMGGFVMALVSMIIAVVVFFAKLLFWNSFQLGIAPIMIGMFFFFSIQLLFMGLIGEYIGAIYTQVRKLPLVVELERVNFNSSAPTSQPVVQPANDF